MMGHFLVLVRARAFDAIDDEYLGRETAASQSQPELLLHRGEDQRRIVGRQAVG